MVKRIAIISLLLVFLIPIAAFAYVNVGVIAQTGNGLTHSGVKNDGDEGWAYVEAIPSAGINSLKVIKYDDLDQVTIESEEDFAVTEKDKKVTFLCYGYYKVEFYDGSSRLGYTHFNIIGPEAVCEEGPYYKFGDSENPDEEEDRQVVEIPGWDDAMDKIDEIINKIPPPPNWDDVAGKIRDEIEDMLGGSPSQPKPPAQPPAVDTGGIADKIPEMPTVPGLDDSGFSPGDIKDEAPEIDFREDPTEGFDLVEDPVNSLPDLPGDSFPEPGGTDAGEWGENKPHDPAPTYPQPPADTGDIDTGTAPKPDDSGAQPPAPGDGGNEEVPTPGDNTGEPPVPGGGDTQPPVPGDGGGEAPTPGGDGSGGGLIYYKPHPDAPDGSGGTWDLQ